MHQPFGWNRPLKYSTLFGYFILGDWKEWSDIPIWDSHIVIKIIKAIMSFKKLN